MSPRNPPPMVCFVGPSNSGKTTLVSALIERLASSGFRVGALKHASHRFDLDRPGKDTYRFREAGAYAIGIASKTERAVITTTERPATLAELAGTLPDGLDLIIAEGYKSEGAPKIEVHRGDRPRLTELEGLIAVVTDGPLDGVEVPQLQHDDIDGVCRLVLGVVGLASPRPSR